jgi:apolipoprotein D and lipocalin family protein
LKEACLRAIIRFGIPSSMQRVRASLKRFGVLCALAAVPALSGCDRERLDVAPEVDLNQFQGKWHEVAHIPRPAQNDCSGTTATYTMQADGKLTFVHECTLSNGGYHGSTAIAKVSSAQTPAKLEVDFGGYIGEYWILEVAPDYRYAVVGHPSRDYLWVLSRTKTMDPKDLEAALAHARQQNFDTGRLEYTPDGPDPQGTPAPAARYGCAASGVGSNVGGQPARSILAILAATGVLAMRRRRASARARLVAAGVTA